MAATQVDQILNIYKQVTKNPVLVSAKIVSTVNNGLTIKSIWSQRNLERQIKQKFSQEFYFDAQLQLLTKSFPLDVTSEMLRTSSKDETLKAILREVTIDRKSKQFIEVWDKQHLIKSYDLSASEVHGDVYSEPTFSAFQWSPDNTRLLYIAEKKLLKCEPFYKQKSKPKTYKANDEDEQSRGTEYIYKPDWGEQLVGKHRSVVVILNINEDTIVPVDSIPNDYFPGQVIWAPNGDDIIGVAYKLYPRYLGLVFCTSRESYIFYLKGKEFRKLTSEAISCRSPRFSPNGKYLVWLERNISLPHDHVQRLVYMKWDLLKTPVILVDVVKDHILIDRNKKFYGLFNQNLPKRCWSDDSNYIFLSSPQRSTVKSYLVNLETKVMTEIVNPDGSSLTVLDVNRNRIVFTKFTPILPSQLIIGRFNPTASNIDNLHLLNCTNPNSSEDRQTLMYDNVEFIYNNNDFIKEFNFTYLGKKDKPEKSMPLIAVPHGGPHVAFFNEFNMSHVIYALLGFGVLQINYRGSTGMGGNNVEYLLGKIGESDVLDCMTAINTALQKYSWLDPKKVSLFGGSHGGFLNAHLSGQYPDMFRAVVMRNPVIELAAMFSISDGPDWCPAETGCRIIGTLPDTTRLSNYSELIQKMLSYSPILHADKVKAPTFIALGSNDLRVPLSQGKLWYFRLTANNVITKLHVYEDNHSLSKDDVEIDFIINTALWLIQHTSDITVKD